jgi:PHD/YefM family antitoxin component YafN of YafNO toxin-antitoxin module
MPTKTLLPENIHPLTDFLRHHKRHLQRLKRSRRPSVLTLNGKAQLVVQDAKAWQAMMEAMEAVEARKGVGDGIGSMERGESQPAEAVFAKLREKRGFGARRQ